MPYERVVRLVLLRIIVVSGLSAIAMAASGCLGDSDAEAESPAATTTGQVDTQPRAQSAVDISKFRAAFKETYGDRPWYGLITGMKVTQNRTLDITMKLDPAREPEVGTICHAAFSAADKAGMGDAIEAVRVVRSDGVEGGCA